MVKSITLDMLKDVKNITVSKDYVVLKFDLKLYDLESLYSAAYSLLDKAYFFFDGDLSLTEVIVIPKNLDNLISIALEYNNSVINYSYYKIRSLKNMDLKKLILSKALFLNDVSADSNLNSESDSFDDELSCMDEESLNSEVDDPDLNLDDVELDDFDLKELEGISIPWEEKYSKDVVLDEREKLSSEYNSKGD